MKTVDADKADADKDRVRIPPLEFRSFWSPEATKNLTTLFGQDVCADLAKVLLDEAVAQCFAHVERFLIEQHGSDKSMTDAMEHWRASHNILSLPGCRAEGTAK